MDEKKVVERLNKLIEERQEQSVPEAYDRDVLWVNAIIALRLTQLRLDLSMRRGA